MNPKRKNFENMLLFEINKITESSSDNVTKKLTNLNTLKKDNFKLDYLIKKLKNSNKNSLIPLTSYIIHINLSNSTSSIVITNRVGDIKAYCTSGLLGFSKTQKYTIISLLKKVVYSYNFLNNTTSIVIFKGLKRYNRLIIARLKKKLHIKAIIYDNLLPHNGCRPKKIRRL